MPKEQASKYGHYLQAVVIVVGSIAVFTIGIVIVEILFTHGLGYFSVLNNRARLHAAVAASQKKLSVSPQPARNAASVIISTLVQSDFDTIESKRSMAVGPDGLPVFSYHERIDYPDTERANELSARSSALYTLKLVKCTDTACERGSMVTVENSWNFPIGTRSSIAVGRDNVPVIVYTVNNGMQFDNQIKMARCGDAFCKNFTVTTIALGKDEEYFRYPLIMIDRSGKNVVVSFMSTLSEGSEYFNIVRCEKDKCDRANQPKILAGGIELMPDYDVALDTNDFVTAVYKTYEGTFHIIKCLDLECNEIKTRPFATVPWTAPSSLSLTLSTDDIPYISATSSYNSDTRYGEFDLFRCLDTACSEAVQVPIDRGNDVGFWHDVALNKAGNLMYSYSKVRLGREEGYFIRELYFTQCRDRACSRVDILKIDEDDYTRQSFIHAYYSIGLSQDGTPVLGYKKTNNFFDSQLKVAKCLSETCR